MEAELGRKYCRTSELNSVFICKRAFEEIKGSLTEREIPIHLRKRCVRFIFVVLFCMAVKNW